MRQRHIKQATIENLSSMGVLFEPVYLDLSSYSKVHLEIGAGKGQFITSLAQDFPNELFIAIEMDKNVCYRIAEKKIEMKLDNLLILLTSAETITDWFYPQMIDIIYLNFSDPWPKAKHHKRRLTWPIMLEKYKTVLKQEGILQFRTDHFLFFEDSIDYIKSHFQIVNVNMHVEESRYMTEYEVKKRQLGAIYQVKGIKST
ncbi:MAG: tRNA (guanosine(46)-N7)-methyltransferase TrmB [Tenericutes bacterium GWC2_34_14]|nr:MAG: tRNA (guanosine(46)-N7)-methyltransferase TrmB [Tenericutes bacterium GWC2_34_14]OHE34564.1 MAG: tRNA (guanosine(46)-N7)-methyltransferase TrmB [Tenericutes bacterium GWE2_34_108]OHE35921.1 MAG: tRNA (guanosine(46)-N7)-methyltransferase TrmB [Tenericutes bacterium GWF1_35_14]OHE38993.1 MAG: tRNA (guanosine(46)-N7)-methyltransferase TrmB [Tenericutes bacterium GWF2_35_184]OHE42322.1 MAG: tRNA (guanosine(46)-N7)-methyltransferase TrmB [Tenericutes bacterium RIFOXYA12_FULL_35_10]OHE42940.